MVTLHIQIEEVQGSIQPNFRAYSGGRVTENERDIAMAIANDLSRGGVAKNLHTIQLEAAKLWGVVAGFKLGPSVG